MWKQVCRLMGKGVMPCNPWAINLANKCTIDEFIYKMFLPLKTYYEQWT
jgi:hypothetical protein